VLDCILDDSDDLVGLNLEVRVVESLCVGQTVLFVGLLALNLLELFKHFLQLTHLLAHDKQFLAYLLAEDHKVRNMPRE